MDDDQVVETTDTTDTGSTNVETTETADNPAWQPYKEVFEKDPALGPLADRIFGLIKPQLAESDRKYQELSEKNARYSAYDDFVNAGVDPQYLRQSVQTFQNLNKSPQEFHRILSEHLGISVAEAKEVAKEVDAQADEGDYENPQIRTLQDQIEQLRNGFEKKEYNEQVSHYSRVISNGIAEAQAAHAGSPIADVPFDEKKVLQYMGFQQNNNEEINPAKAYQAWANDVTAYRSFPSRGSQAPRITPSGGGGTSLPLETDNGKIPESVIRQGFDAVTKWTMQNVLNKQ